VALLCRRCSIWFRGLQDGCGGAAAPPYQPFGGIVKMRLGCPEGFKEDKSGWKPG